MPNRSCPVKPPALLRMPLAWRPLIAMLAALACVWGLWSVQAVAQELSHAGTEHMQPPASASVDCGKTELSCQDAAEREVCLPAADLAAAERPFLVHSSRSQPLAQTSLAPPERPPRLQA